MSGLRLRVLTSQQFEARKPSDSPVLMAASPNANALDELVACVLEEWDGSPPSFGGQLWVEVPVIQTDPEAQTCG